MQRIGYQAQVIPALLAGLSLAYLEIFWRKHIPEVISMIFVPFLSLIPALILAHTVWDRSVGQSVKDFQQLYWQV